jgi:hypothetical protein
MPHRCLGPLATSRKTATSPNGLKSKKQDCRRDQRRYHYPLFRLNLYQSLCSSYLSVSTHHAVYDGLAFPLLMREVDAAYRAQSLQDVAGSFHFHKSSTTSATASDTIELRSAVAVNEKVAKTVQQLVDDFESCVTYLSESPDDDLSLPDVSDKPASGWPVRQPQTQEAGETCRSTDC